MSTATSLERRLRLGGELLSVVGTMKGLSAASIRAFEDAVHALREYTRTIELGLQAVFSIHPELLPSSVEQRGRTVAIVIGTDQGLCGPINREVVRSASLWLREHAAERSDRWVVALGARTTRELESAGVSADEELPLPSSVAAIGPFVEELILRIDQWRHHDQVGRVMAFHQRPRRRAYSLIHQVTPPDVRRLQAIASRPWPTRMRPDTPHAWDEVLIGLLRQDLLVALYRAIAEAKAAEHGARLSAMQTAEKNIEELIDRLRHQYHQLRQAQITAELLDVISGFEVLRDD